MRRAAPGHSTEKVVSGERCGAAAASTCARRLKTHHCVFRSTEREGGRVGIVTRVAGLHVATDLRDAAVQLTSVVVVY